MPKRSHLFFTISAAVMLAAIACGGEKAAEPTVSKGVISVLGRSIGVDPVTTIVDLVQTDAAINPGNSGGAVVNTRAQVVGINTAIIPGSQGIGFAINIDDVKVVVAQLIATGTVERGFLGINMFSMNPGLANVLVSRSSKASRARARERET